MTPNKNLLLFYKNVRLAIGLLVLVGISFAGYVYTEQQRHATDKLRLRSLLLADELRRSSNDLTRMVRTYVVTGNPIYKQYYQEILDIREGKKPRPAADYIYWDVLVVKKQQPELTGQTIAYLDLIQQENFTAAEIAKLTQAKAKSDQLTQIEWAAMAVIESDLRLDTDEHHKAEHYKAIEMLFDDTYRQAKAEIMQPISDFNQMVEQRTSAAVIKTQQTAQLMCAVFSGFALLLIATIELLYRRLNSVLGGSLKQLQKQIEQIGSGNFSNPISVAQGMENSVLGWLAQTQANLIRLDETRQKTEDALKSTNLAYAEAQKMAHIGYWIHNLKTNTPFWSDELYRIFGFEPQEVPASIELFFEQIAHPDDKEFINQKYQAHLKNQQDFDISYRIVRRDGSIRFVQSNCRSDFDPQGLVQQTRGVILDITERKKQEEAVVAREKELRLLADAMPQIVWATTPDGQAIYFNQQWYDYTGLNLEESCGNGWYKAVHPNDLPYILHIWQQALEKETAYLAEFRLRRADNSYRPMLIRSMPVRDEQGKVYKWFGTTTDIQELKEKEQLLTYQIDLNQKIISESAAGIQVFKDSGECIACNKTTAKILDKTVDEVLQENFYQIPMWQTSGLVDIAQTCLQESSPQHQEIHSNFSSGKQVWLDYHFSNFISNGDLYLLVLVHDVSEYRQLEQVLRQAKTEAQAASQAKSDFLANMSHEIRTPMNAVIGMSHLMLNTKLNQKQQDLMKKIQRASNHLMGIITDILDFSKIEAGKFELEQNEFEVEKLLDNVTTLMFAKATAKALELLIKVDALVPDYLVGDSGRLSQILVNYVDNAIKFSERGQIVIEMQLKQVYDKDVLMYFAVHDQGIGLTEEQQTLLFQRFQQIDPSSTRKFGGTGLGLSIAKSLAELMGGEVGLVSEYGSGSTFWFTARLGKSSRQKTKLLTPAPALSEAIALKMQSVQGARLLLVEDDELNQDVVIGLLKEAGLAVDVAENGKIALEKIQQHSYDIVLMDVQMPVMDGIAATRAIREMPQFINLPIIALTANVTDSNCQECEAAGMNDLMCKPVQPEELWSKLLQWLKPLADNTPAQPLAAVEIDRAELEKICQQLSVLLEESNCEVTDFVENNQELLQQAFAQNYPSFYAAIQNFDFDTAFASLKQMAAALQIAIV